MTTDPITSRPDPIERAAARKALQPKGEKDWVTIIFLSLTPVIGILGTAIYTWRHGFHWWMAALFVAMYLAVGISITAGYHRFFSHKTYECSAAVQVFYAIFGAMAAQNSILWWSSSHRVHHQYVDRDWDPYNIQRGFWWAHIAWIFYRHDAPDAESNAADLLRNRVVLWQDRWYRTLLLVAGFGIPAAIGALFGDPLAGLLWGGFLRLTVIHHTTFFVNSLAHYVGSQRYNAEVSARDNWMVALLTLGEGYHSFHHRFPSDFRNGIRWYDWDPAKWVIRTLRSVGLASSLRSVPPPQIASARMQAELHVIRTRLDSVAGRAGDEVRKRIETARAHLESATVLWRQSLEERTSARAAKWRITRRNARAQLRQSSREWRIALGLMRRLPLSS